MTDPSTPEAPKSPEAEAGNIWYRRNLTLAAIWTLVLLCAGALPAFVRSLFPRVLFEPSQRFLAGRPEDYGIDEVSSRFVESERAWIVRSSSGFIALLARCTHLGCTPRWLETERKFKCPCHGSGFTVEGVNFEGPAPMPLYRLGISLNADGYLEVDRGKRYRREEWNRPGAFLRF